MMMTYWVTISKMRAMLSGLCISEPEDREFYSKFPLNLNTTTYTIHATLQRRRGTQSTLKLQSLLFLVMRRLKMRMRVCRMQVTPMSMERSP
jgi:hypothetical protein